MPKAVTEPFLILGEGKRDRLFFEKLCEARGISSFQVDEGSGFTGFQKVLEGSWSARSGFDQLRGLLIVGDNDPNENKTFASIKDQLQNANLAAPLAPLQVATKRDSPPVAIVMMPFLGGTDNVIGALESILIPVIEKRHPIQTECFNAMFSCSKAHEWKSASSKDKLRVRCILSSACEDNPMCGVEVWFGGSQNLIPFDDPIFDPLAELLAKVPEWFESGVKGWHDWKRANIR